MSFLYDSIIKKVTILKEFSKKIIIGKKFRMKVLNLIPKKQIKNLYYLLISNFSGERVISFFITKFKHRIS